MPDFSLEDGGIVTTVGADSGSTSGTTVTANSSSHTDGSWVQLTASTPHVVNEIMVSFVNNGGSNVGLLDIGVGGAGSEVEVISDIYIDAGGSSDRTPNQDAHFAISIPAGVRLAARWRSKAGSSTVDMIAHLICRPLSSASLPRRVTSYGLTPAASDAVTIDPGTPANTKGSWIEVTSATTYAASLLTALFGPNGNAAMTTAQWLIDIGIGAAGSEQVIVADLPLQTNTNTDMLTPWAYSLLPVQIPAGTRVAMRAQCTITDATDRLVDGALYLM